MNGHPKMTREIRSSQRLVRKILVEIDENTGSPQLLHGSSDVSITDNGVGDYTLTITEPGNRLLGVQVTVKTADAIAQVGTASASSVQILGFDATDGTTAKEIDCYVEITISHAADAT